MTVELTDNYVIVLTEAERNAFIEMTGQEPHEFIREKIVELLD